MTLLSKHRDAAGLDDRLHDADAVTAKLLSDVIGETWRRPTAKTARIERLIGTGAWTDAALALIELELPQWQVRRIVYDGGEWHCALSRQRELPDWLDQSVEVHHQDLALALLSAFVEARRSATPRSRTSVPPVRRNADLQGIPVCCDNFA
ncbi:MAG TPA: hypothetical protein VN926_20980 [Bradyrhizobium sp.]|jgi:hypothetical protein|nr:hypothetical protein [Bradyrhizobium sp.]